MHGARKPCCSPQPSKSGTNAGSGIRLSYRSSSSPARRDLGMISPCQTEEELRRLARRVIDTYQAAVLQLQELAEAFVLMHGVEVRHNTTAIIGSLRAHSVGMGLWQCKMGTERAYLWRTLGDGCYQFFNRAGSRFGHNGYLTLGLRFGILGFREISAFH